LGGWHSRELCFFLSGARIIIRARAYAKTNLYLAVVGTRTDGYHDIETIFQSVDLADELTFEVAESIQVSCSNPELCTPGNLAQVAAEELRRASGRKLGALIHIDKRIPVAAGLAGGSADAAATLVALNRLWHLGCSMGSLSDIGARVGSDVPFCLLGGTAFGKGRGTELSRVSPLRQRPIVLAKPEGELPAAKVYATYDESRVVAKRPSALLRAFLDGDQRGDICCAMENTLEPAVLRLMPSVGRVKEAALEAGAACAIVSGSGPAVCALAHSRAQANAVAAALRPLCQFVRVCGPVDRGVDLLDA